LYIIEKKNPYKNYRLPLDPAPDFVLQLLQGIRRNIVSVPDIIRTDFTTTVDELTRLARQPQVLIPVSAISIALGALYPDSMLSGPSSKHNDYAMSASVPSLRIASPVPADNGYPQTAFIAHPAPSGHPRRGYDTQPRSVDHQRPDPPRSDSRFSRATTTSGSRPASRAEAAPDLENLMKSFKAMQSEFTQYRNELKQSRRHDRPTAFAGTAVSTSIDADPDIIDPEYAMSARECFDADAAHARAVRSAADDSKSRQFFDLPDDDEDY